MAKPPRFRFIATLGVHARSADARRVLGDALGLEEIASDPHHLSFAGRGTAIFVDTSGASAALGGFTPLFACEDLAEARAHLVRHGCSVTEMPWSGPGILVDGPGGLRFCVAERAADNQEAPPVRRPRRENPPPRPLFAGGINEADFGDVEDTFRRQPEDQTNFGPQRPVSIPSEFEETAPDVVPALASALETDRDPDADASEEDEDVDDTETTRAVPVEELRAAMRALEQTMPTPIGPESAGAARDEQETVTRVITRGALDAALLEVGLQLQDEFALPTRRRSTMERTARETPLAIGRPAAPAPGSPGPSIADPDEDPPGFFDEDDDDDDTAAAFPTSTLLERAKPGVDATRLAPPSPAMLNAVGPSFDADAFDDETARSSPQASLLNQHYEREAEYLDGIDDDDDDGDTIAVATIATIPATVTGVKLAPAAKRVRNAPVGRELEDSAPVGRELEDSAPVGRELEDSAPVGRELEDSAPEFPVPDLDEDTSRDSRRARQLHGVTEREPSANLPRAPAPRRAPVRPRRPLDDRSGPMLFGGTEEEQSRSPVPPRSEEVGSVFTENKKMPTDENL